MIKLKDILEGRTPRKKGQKAKSKKHSDLYTDEDPKGTIHGLGFKDAATAKKGVGIINKADRKHAHKVQATLVMKQRAKVAKERTKDPEKKKNLSSAYKIWSDKLEQLKKKTKSMKEAIIGNKIECDNCNWSWNIKDGGDDLYICHKCGHDNESISETDYHSKLSRGHKPDWYQLNTSEFKPFNEMEENFADGKKPGRKGLSQRVGIPKGATLTQLAKLAKAKGEKGRLARWQLNMRRGKKKKSK